MPVQVPGLAVSVCPSWAVPEIEGAAVLAGAVPAALSAALGDRMVMIPMTTSLR